MAKVSLKSTKAEILEAYQAVKKQMDDMEAKKDDPVENIKKEHKKQMFEQAEDILSMGILNDEISNKYKSFKEAVKIQEERLRELYEIEAEANSMTALVNAHKELEGKLEQRRNDTIAEINKELQALREEQKELRDTYLAENSKILKDLSVEREREAEEYRYNLMRNRKKEEDAWNDEKAKREKELEDKEKNLEERESSLESKQEYYRELEEKVAGIDLMLKEASANGEKKGKAEADKSNSFEVRTINMKNEYEQKILNEKISVLEKALEDSETKAWSLQEKLDAAYSQMRELATDTVKNNGGIKILDRENDKK